MPDLILTSGREDLWVAVRVDLLRSALMYPPFVGVSDRSATQDIHDVKLTIGRVRNTIALFDMAIMRGTDINFLHKTANGMLSCIECLVLAWRRGGYVEYQRVRKVQHTLGV